MQESKRKTMMSSRFRGFLPVVIDVETSGLNPISDALLEIAAVTLEFDSQGLLKKNKTFAFHVDPFMGANIDPESLLITGIDPSHPLRLSVPEKHALHQIFCQIKKEMEITLCDRAVLVGHNAWFDLAFVLNAAKRSSLRFNPFHTFTSFDTASLSAVALGETVLAKALKAVGIPFDVNYAHSAIYDAEKTADLFCWLVNSTKLK